MDIIEAIYTRRSIRKYTNDPVSDEDLKVILNAGFCAPSAHNKKPWHFIVVKEPSVLNSIAQFHPYAQMLPSAGCAIIVCGDKNCEGMAGFLIEDCSAAIQNILLASHGLGLGAVWCGLYPVPKLTKNITSLLNLPENIIPIGLVSVGHKAEDRTPSDRYDQTRIHYNKW